MDVDVFSVDSVAQVLGSSNTEFRILQKQNIYRNTESLDYADGKRPPDGVSRMRGELPAANPQCDLSSGLRSCCMSPHPDQLFLAALEAVTCPCYAPRSLRGATQALFQLEYVDSEPPGFCTPSVRLGTRLSVSLCLAVHV